ncbi:MAG: galactose mutarotase [Lachnospiraceae bacterium]|nr:galactose mutarotase [Lachnospiraceae bacterium]
MSVEKKEFGKTKDGKVISLYTISNGRVSVAVTDYGANVVSICAPNDRGEVKDLVMGYDKAEDYFVNSCFFGACVGRSANRIKDAKFSIDGTEYKLAVNDGPNNLHSDFDNGFHKQMWNAEIGDDAVIMTINSPDMENGFPGNMKVTMTYSLTKANEFKLEYEALSDKKTLFNMTNHTYFNLGGHDAGEKALNETMLNIKASHYTPVVEGAIPTGEIAPVKDTVFDFTTPKKIGDDIDKDIEQLKLVQGYDHNYVIDGYDKSIREIAKASYDGRTMIVYTDLPGVQFYAGNCIADDIGKGGAKYSKRGAFCLETQFYPDSINQEGFIKPVIEANVPFKTTTVYQFV